MPTGNNWKLNVPTSSNYGFGTSPSLYTAAGKSSVNPLTLKYGNKPISQPKTWWEQFSENWVKGLGGTSTGSATASAKTSGSTVQGTLDELGQLFYAVAVLVGVVLLYKIFRPTK